MESNTEVLQPTSNEKVAVAVGKIKVLDQFVLIKQIMTKKKTVIHMDAAKDDRSKFNYSFEIVKKGNKCERDIEIGDHPIFSEYVRFSGLKIIEKNEEKMVTLIFVHENDIIGTDSDSPETE